MNISQLQGQRLKQFREYLGLNQGDFAIKVNVMRPYLSQMESGARNLSYNFLMDVANCYNVSIDWLLNGKGKMINGTEGELQIATSAEPNISLMDITVSAGAIYDTDLAGQVLEKFSLPGIRGGGYYGLYVDGDSMTPTYNNGDLVVVRKIDQSTFKQDEVYLINLRGSLPVLKRVRRKSQLEFELHSDNASIGPYSVEVQSIADLFRVYAVIRHK